MKSPFNLSDVQAIRLAAGGLWARLISVVALGVFVAVRAEPGFWLSLIDLMLSAAALALWVPLMRELLQGRPVLLTDPRRRALGSLYPWLVAYEGALWFLWLLNVLLGGLPEANPVAVTALLTAWGASVAVNLLVYLFSLRVMVNPADATGRGQLADLFDLAAALAVASLVMTLVPLGGTPPPTRAEQWAYGLAGVVEVASWLLLRRAVRAGKTAPEAPSSG